MIWAVTRSSSTPLRASSARSSPVSSRRNADGRFLLYRKQRRGALPPPQLSADERDQRDADGRRHAGAAHNFHGGGAAVDGGCAGRSAENERGDNQRSG